MKAKEEAPEPPTERRNIVNDATIEKLGELLNQNPGRGPQASPKHGLRLNTTPFANSTLVRTEQEREATIRRLLGGNTPSEEFVPIADLREQGAKTVQVTTAEPPVRDLERTTALDIDPSEI